MRILIITLCCTFLGPIAWAGDSPRLRELFEQDQSDRMVAPGKSDWLVISQRDTERRGAVLDLIRSGSLTTANDFYHAAMVFQHGNSAEDISLAYSLATVATRFEPTHRSARWLTAAAWDRLLMRNNKPQWYGTQFTKGPSGKWELYPVDEAAVTDAERERLGVPTLAASKQRASGMNGE